MGDLLWIGGHAHPEILQPVVYLTQFCTCDGRDKVALKGPKRH